MDSEKNATTLIRLSDTDPAICISSEEVTLIGL